MNVKPVSMRKPLNGKANFDDLLSNLTTPQAKKPRTSLGTPSRPSPGGGNYATPSRTAQTGATPGSSLKRATPPTSRFETRTNALEVVESLNDHLVQAPSGSGSTSRVALASAADPAQYNYRYMFEKIMDRSEVLDNKIDECAELMKQYYDIEDFGDPGAASQDDLFYIGRIQSETSESTESHALDAPMPVSKLSATSMVLETSRLLGAGARISLRFEKGVKVRGADDGQGGVGLFPGMIVAVRGRNAGGSYIGVQEVLVMPPLDLGETSVSDLTKYQYGENKLAGKPLSIMTACGPYTTEDNLDFAPLDALCAEAKRTKPDVLLLMGPFIDDRHPLIKAGDVDDLPSGIFASHISSRLGNIIGESPSTNVILIPSTRDLISKNAVFPQGPYDRDTALMLPKRVKLLPNPAMFSINEVVFAVTSTDTLFHLNNQEIFKDAGDVSRVKQEGTSSDAPDLSSDAPMLAPVAAVGPKDRMARMCRHVLRQRSFYPVFPSPMGAGIEPINLDVTHLDLAKLTQGPDVVILPSMLRYFVKTVDSTVVINPSTLARASNGGTFARLTIHPMAKHELEGGSLMHVDGDAETHLEHRIYERARVDIIRI